MFKHINSLFFFLLIGGGLLAQDFGYTVDPQNVTIVRDQWGIPHIYGKTDADVAYGVAWAQGEDHFELVQQVFLFSKGLLGPVYGKGGAAADFFYHASGMSERVDDLMEDLDPQFIKYVEGFCQGINAYAVANKKGVLNKDLFPVTVKDVMIGYPLRIAQFVGYTNTVGAVVNGRFDDRIDKAALQMKGSNAFAFNKKMTKDGKTYLIINPHVGFSGPESWYEIHLASEEGLDFHGAMFPGSLSPQLGSNRHLGWAHTNNYFDLIDTYALKMHPTNPLQYEFDGKWESLEKQEIKLKVKVAGIKIGVKRNIYFSKYGPTFESEGGKFAAVRTPAIFGIKAAQQWYYMNRASSFDEFQKALEIDGLPYFNITYADKDDNIMYLFNGHFPKRKAGYQWKNSILPGNTSETLWTEYIPLEERPRIFNPDCGFVYNVNHNPFKCTCEEQWLDEVKYDTLADYKGIDDLPRSLRFREIYKTGQKVSMEELKKIKYDATWPEAYPLTKVVRRIQAFNPSNYPDITDMLAIFRGWDLAVTPESQAPTLLYLVNEFAEDKRVYLTNEKAPTDEQILTAIRDAKAYMVEKFGFVTVPWKNFSVMRRGGKEAYAFGFPGLLAARFNRFNKEEGRAIATGGDTFMMFLKFGDEGVESAESIVPYGNSRDPKSPHYNDQMDIYSQKKAKRVSFDKEEIMKNGKRVYHPGE